MQLAESTFLIGAAQRNIAMKTPVTGDRRAIPEMLPIMKETIITAKQMTEMNNEIIIIQPLRFNRLRFFSFIKITNVNPVQR